MNCCFTDHIEDECENRRMDNPPMCQKHMRLTFRMALVEGALPADVFKVICQDAIEALGIGENFQRMGVDFAIAAARREREAEEARRKAETHGTVYYVRLTGGRVKIGWTIDLLQRMAAFRARAEDVLATEPGSMDLEKQRHRQFAADRIDKRREDFRHSAQLARHIEQIAGQCA